MGIGRIAACLLAALSLALASTPANAQTTDRASLIALAQRYLDAMVKHDPRGLPIAPSVRSTENGRPLRIGAGLWQTLDKVDATQFFADSKAGQVGVYAAGTEPDGSAIFLVRLKVESGKISESEIIVARHGRLSPEQMQTPEGRATLNRGDGASVYQPDGIGKRNAHYEAPLAPGDRPTREQLKAAANGYFNSVHLHDAKQAPFGPNCDRFENGGKTTNVSSVTRAPTSCAESVEFLQHIQSVTNRRFPLFDEERGLVWGMGVFNVAGLTNTTVVRDGKTVELPAFMKEPRSFIIGELFRVVKGQLEYIEVVMVDRQLWADTGWPTEVEAPKK